MGTVGFFKTLYLSSTFLLILVHSLHKEDIKMCRSSPDSLRFLWEESSLYLLALLQLFCVRFAPMYLF